MSEKTYAAVQPLIADQKVVGSRLDVVFRCPETGREFPSSAQLRTTAGPATTAKAAVKRSLLYGLRNSVLRAVSSSVGHGVAGQAARDVAYGAMSGVTGSGAMKPGKADLERAVLEAFEKVKDRFRWDGRWSAAVDAEPSAAAPAPAAPEAGDFEARLAQSPVVERYDRGVLARMLVEIACADGTVDPEERDFVGGFLEPEMGSVEEIAGRSRLSRVEIEEVAPGPVRETLMMLAWATALSDDALEPAEETRLGEFAEALGVPAPKAAELRSVATGFLLEQAIAEAYPGGKRDEVKRAEAMLFAARLGVPSEQVERAEVRYRKRMGIF